MTEAFVAWLMKKLGEANESDREASLKAGLNHGAVTNYLKGSRPSVASCRKLAEHFGVPVEQVLYLVGHIDPPPVMNTFLREMAQIVETWTPEQRGMLLEWARAYPARRTDSASEE